MVVAGVLMLTTRASAVRGVTPPAPCTPNYKEYHMTNNRLEEIRARAAAKYQDLPFGEPLNEPCPGCGCVSFAAARYDVDTLLQLLDARPAVGEDSRDEGHHLPNYLWCKRCQAWIETEHVCGARYLDKGDYFELIQPAAPPVTCAWTYNPDGYWQTSCDDQFCISEGSPAENRMRYCHYCGRRITTSAEVGVIDAAQPAP